MCQFGVYVCVHVYVCRWVLCLFVSFCMCVFVLVLVCQCVCVWNLELRLLAGHHLHEFYKEKNKIKIVYN